jgi:hypothetical protein
MFGPRGRSLALRVVRVEDHTFEGCHANGWASEAGASALCVLIGDSATCGRGGRSTRGGGRWKDSDGAGAGDQTSGGRAGYRTGGGRSGGRTCGGGGTRDWRRPAAGACIEGRARDHVLGVGGFAVDDNRKTRVRVGVSAREQHELRGSGLERSTINDVELSTLGVELLQAGSVCLRQDVVKKLYSWKRVERNGLKANEVGTRWD